MSAPKHRKAQPRRILAAQAAALRAEGLSGIAIADRLRISRSYAYELLNDPTGAADRERKEQYGGTCADCGARTSYNVGGATTRCHDCNAQRSGDRQHARGQDVALRVLNLRRNGLTNRAIAEMLGVHEQSVSRSLTRLRRQGVAVPLPPYWSRAQDEVAA